MFEALYVVLDWISIILNNSAIFGVIIIALLLLGENRNSKRAKIAAAIFVALLAGFALKEMFKVPRPCLGETVKIACPDDYSFPSLHATAAFALMIAFINKEKFAYYLLFALITVFTRLYLGVHTIEDVAAGLVVATISYYAVDKLAPKEGKY